MIFSEESSLTDSFKPNVPSTTSSSFSFGFGGTAVVSTSFAIVDKKDGTNGQNLPSVQCGKQINQVYLTVEVIIFSLVKILTSTEKALSGGAVSVSSTIILQNQHVYNVKRKKRTVPRMRVPKS